MITQCLPLTNDTVMKSQLVCTIYYRKVITVDKHDRSPRSATALAAIIPMRNNRVAQCSYINRRSPMTTPPTDLVTSVVNVSERREEGRGGKGWWRWWLYSVSYVLITSDVVIESSWDWCPPVPPLPAPTQPPLPILPSPSGHPRQPWTRLGHHHRHHCHPKYHP